ncbi:MAG: aminotransferase class I/II-fold pyridoxal phosphate-dependent enzyme [Lachnospiraceae bacterium]|nr:aminotransferase class I/II-fold pyridoxal phosphate-dependent enzyme [Lachnospiraceae bacterium]
MIKHKDHFHGSDLEEIEKIYGINKNEIISFSANVNPLGISKRLASELSDHIRAIENYPDREYKGLREAISAYCGAPMSEIIVGNGSTELISLFVGITKPRRALIIGPTYSEYEREITLAGGKSSYFPLRAKDDFKLDTDELCERLKSDVDLLIICNPNNPTSSSISKSEIRHILDVCKEHSIYVMVDETYVEFSSEPEKISSIPLTEFYNNIIILRGTSKFFAAPGLRLGYAVTGNEDLSKEINQHKNPWMINSLAEVAGTIMFADNDYIKSTRDLIRSERDRLFEKYQNTERFKPYSPTANFMLLAIRDEDLTSHMLFEKAIREKMMIRDCSTFPFLDEKYIRICFMNPDDNDRLFDCLNS